MDKLPTRKQIIASLRKDGILLSKAHLQSRLTDKFAPFYIDPCGFIICMSEEENEEYIRSKE